jgi:glycosyltransferase involved in cell wall biosynthesis
MQQPNTLLISPYFDAGLPSGGVLYSIDMAREWLARGRQVHVICIDRTRRLADLEAYVATGQLVLHPIAAERASRFTHHPDPALYTTTREVLRMARPEIIHVHNIQGMLSAVAAAIDEGPPILLTALDFGLICLNFYLYAGSLRPCDSPMSARACTTCIRRTLRGPARVLGPLLPRFATRRIWPRFVRLDQIKAIGEMHGLMRHVLRSVRTIIAPSPAMRDRLVECGAPPGRVINLTYGISPEKIVRPPKQISECLRLGYVGGADRIKGFATVLRSLDHLPAGLPLRVRAFGGESLRQVIAGQSIKVQQYIECNRPLFGRPLMEEHARIDATLVPSVWQENSPFAVLESFANGTPVLGSDQPGISHLITPDRDGWLIKPGNPAAWARAFIRAVQHPARIRAMQVNAKYLRTTADFVNDVEWIEQSLPGRTKHQPPRSAIPPVAVYA